MISIKHKSIKPTPGVKRIQNYLFKFSDLLGKGNFSSVYKGVNQHTSQTVAIKYIALSSLTCERLKELLDQEIQILTSLNHHNVVKCFEVLKSAHNCYLITQLCDGGDLQGLVKNKGKLSEQEATPYIRDIFEGLCYISKKNIVHRDIKSANIFINKGKAKIADFGFAQRAKSQFNDGKIGTPLCMSPQGFLQNLYGCKTDVWAFGIILYQLTHGRLHLDQCTNEQKLRQQIKVQLRIDQLRPELSHQLRQLIIKCLDVNPCTRITFQQMRSNAFIRRITNNRMQPFSLKDLKFIPSSYGKQNSHQKQQISHGKNKICQNSAPQNMKMKAEKQQKGICRPANILNPTITYIPMKKQNIGDQSPGVSQSPLEQNGHSIKSSSKSHTRLPTQILELGLNTAGQKSMQSTTDRSFFDIPVTPMNIPFKRHRGSFQMTSAQQVQIQENICRLRTTVKGRASFDVNTITNTKRLLSGFLKFNEAIGVIHFCRLIYKYINELKTAGIYHQGDLNLRYYSNYLINLLNELSSKITSDHVIISKGSTQDENKLSKMLKVVEEYIQRYRPNLEKQRAEHLNRTTGQIKHILQLDKKFIQSFYISDKSKLQIYNDKSVKFSEILERSSRYQRYTQFDSNKQLEDATRQDKKQRVAFMQRFSQNSLKYFPSKSVESNDIPNRVATY